MQHPLLPQPPGRHGSGAPSVFKRAVTEPSGACDKPSATMDSCPPEIKYRDALRSVIDPELRRDIVELEMVRSIDVHENGVVDVHGLADDAGLPDPQPLPDRGGRGGARARGRQPGSTSAFDVLSDNEKAALGHKLGRGALPEGALAQVRNVICVGSGKGGVGKSSVTANLAAALAADGKQVGVLDADVWGYSQPRMLGLGAERPHVNGERKLDPADRPRRHQRDVDRILHRAGCGGRLARPDAPQGAPAVPRGRRLGRARLPPDRPAAGHRRRLDDARSAAAPGEVRDRDHAAAGRPEGRPPLRRDGRPS